MGNPRWEFQGAAIEAYPCRAAFAKHNPIQSPNMQNLHMQNLHLRNFERPHARARGGKDFDLCKMGVYLGVYQHNMKIKYLIKNALNHQFKSHCHHQTKTAQISGLFFMSNATNVPS